MPHNTMEYEEREEEQQHHHHHKEDYFDAGSSGHLLLALECLSSMEEKPEITHVGMEYYTQSSRGPPTAEDSTPKYISTTIYVDSQKKCSQTNWFFEGIDLDKEHERAARLVLHKACLKQVRQSLAAKLQLEVDEDSGWQKALPPLKWPNTNAIKSRLVAGHATLEEAAADILQRLENRECRHFGYFFSVVDGKTSVDSTCTSASDCTMQSLQADIRKEQGKLAECRLAFFMGQHSRLGRGSMLLWLDQHLLDMIWQLVPGVAGVKERDRAFLMEFLSDK